VEYNNIGAIKKATSAQTCAVMLEPIQGEGGVNVPDDGYLKAVRAWCDQKGILLILDEVQTGIGRIGTLFGYEQFGIEPDIISLAKGLGGGIPIGALLTKEKSAVFALGEHGSTFGGNPLACAAGYVTLNFIIENDIPSKVKRSGDYLIARLNKLKANYNFIVEVRGRGLLVAIQFNSDLTQNIVKSCMERGLLLNPVKPNAIRFMPPLTIAKREIDEAITILDKVLAKV
jgi:acetylornithine/succinyldiaminopimelate/putrescine aminotransferase